MFSGLSTIRQIAAFIRQGHDATIGNDTAVPNGWHIDIGGHGYCGYRTRQDARDALRSAREMAST